MMTIRLRFLASSFGSAEMPSSSGISISRMAMSGLMRSTWLTAARPVRSDAATTISGSELNQREMMPLMTTESSTSMTRSGSGCTGLGAEGLVNATLILTNRTQLTIREAKHFASTVSPATREPPDRRLKSDQADFLELGRHDVLVERLHDVLVGAGVKRARDVRDIVLRGAEHHLGLIAARHAAKISEELVAVHDRHVPVEQNGFRQSALADFKRLLAVFSFHDLEIQSFLNAPCNLSDDAGVIPDQTCFHCCCLRSQTRLVLQLRVRLSQAAIISGESSSTRSTSRTTINCPSRRCTPPASLAMRGARLTGFSSRPSSGSLSTSPIWSIKRP